MWPCDWAWPYIWLRQRSFGPYQLRQPSRHQCKYDKTSDLVKQPCLDGCAQISERHHSRRHRAVFLLEPWIYIGSQGSSIWDFADFYRLLLHWSSLLWRCKVHDKGKHCSPWVTGWRRSWSNLEAAWHWPALCWTLRPWNLPCSRREQTVLFPELERRGHKVQPSIPEPKLLDDKQHLTASGLRLR